MKLLQLLPTQGNVASLSFVAKTGDLFVASTDGTARLFELRGNELTLAASLSIRLPWVYTTTFQPDGSLLAISGRGPIQLWDAARWEFVKEIHFPGSDVTLPGAIDNDLYSTALSNDGRWLWGSGIEGVIWTFSVEDGSIVAECPAEDVASSLCVSPNQSLLAGTFSDEEYGGNVVFCRIENEGRLAKYDEFRFQHKMISGGCFSPNGNWFAFGHQKLVLLDLLNLDQSKAFDLNGNLTSQEEDSTLDKYMTFWSEPAFSADGRLLYAGGRDGKIRAWDVSSGSVIEEVQGHDDAIRRIVVNHAKEKLVSYGLDHVLKLWDLVE